MPMTEDVYARSREPATMPCRCRAPSRGRTCRSDSSSDDPHSWRHAVFDEQDHRAWVVRACVKACFASGWGLEPGVASRVARSLTHARGLLHG